jgi:hypothetical protein
MGVLTIEVSDNVEIGTWNNALSDFLDKTLIEPDTALFATLTSLAQGDEVYITGYFFKSDVDCVKESSLTLNGSMTEPYFIFRFTEISKK